MRRTMAVTAALLATISTMPVSAQAPANRAVAYAGLDLSTPAGRATLDRRIGAAVETVCGSYAGASSYELREIDRCRAAARTGIETQLAVLQARHARITLGSR